MSIHKRKNSAFWYVDIRTPGGGRVRHSTGTSDKREAQEYHDKVKHELWRTVRLGEQPAYTFDEAAVRLLKESEHLSDYTNRERHIRYFRKFFGGQPLAAITRDAIYASLPERNGWATVDRPVSVATKNRYLATIRLIFNAAAHKWEWIERAPRLADYKVSNKRIRWITKDEARRLLDSISVEWMRDVAALGFATGLRQSNILFLEWSQVDLVNRRAWIHPDQAKARKPIGVPLNDDAVAVIRRWIGRHQTRVFIRAGKPIKNWCAAQWTDQCARAGITNFRFHDVRHTWASWHVQGGTPLNRLMELGGWAKYEHVLRYAHLAPDHLAEHAQTVALWDQSGGDQPETRAA
ncbi:tyrosine-type recombinase/integrase [Burkholderia gladioli]|uniref:tyrosine-type recombinase/integrase n=1 Tax=Burkholderia gladioli TaxID=28095 RepID=UPI003D1A95A5